MQNVITRFWLNALALLAISLTVASVSAADRLQWKLKADDRLKVTTNQSVVTNTTYTGSSVESTMNFLIESEWQVTGVADEMIDLTQTVTRAKVEMQSPKSDLVIYDSGDEKRPTGLARQLQSAIKPLIGLEAKLKINSRGEILSAELPMAATEPAESDASNKASSASAEVLKSLLSKALLILPEEEIEPGATWKAETESSLPGGQVKTDKTYRLERIEEVDGQRVAQIAGEAKIELSSQAKLKMTDSDFQQTAVFAIQDGIITSSEQKVRMKTEKPFRETTIVVDMTMTQKTTIERVK